MKIRIEISSGNVSCVMDKEVDMAVNPQAIIEDIEDYLSHHEVDPDIISCYYCDNLGTPVQEEPCRSCMAGEHPYTEFTRSIW